MDYLKTLISLLDRADDELWGNVWSNDAFSLLQRESAFLLPAIIKQWRDWPVHRQEHLAVLLGSIGTPEEKILIIEMLDATDPQVRNRTQEALEEL
ncbi:hypothetical protein V0R48_14110 [Pseudomonas alcaligenes]|uniref:hypothetical protein n=1 Tax=Aquipseudomonas alcaligenes TaxID=43263 RepID=UPI002E7AC37B|nr:hypothetical protein [Pseudomonas alcaligenes]MEE1950119.1 hypothetical protein [Pseudomonas alcaligenes]